MCVCVCVCVRGCVCECLCLYVEYLCNHISLFFFFCLVDISLFMASLFSYSNPHVDVWWVVVVGAVLMLMVVVSDAGGCLWLLWGWG